MTRAVAIGDGYELAGYAIAGVSVSPSTTPDQARAALEALSDAVELLILTPEAHAALSDVLEERSELIYAVVPPP